MNKIKKIIEPFTSIFETSNPNSQLTSEALYGEEIVCLEKYKNKILIKLLTDDYTGWVLEDSLGELPFSTHMILSPRAFLFSIPDIKSKIINYLSIGSKIKANKFSKDWYKVKFFHNSQLIDAFVLKTDLILSKNKVNDWVSTAESLVNTPYKWGGRSSIGIDCSALIQVSLNTGGIKVPRDSNLQMNLKNMENIFINNIKRGSIIFWEGHVGVMINEEDFLHANSFHMKTIIEPIKTVINRAIEANSQIIKIVDVSNF